MGGRLTGKALLGAAAVLALAGCASDGELTVRPIASPLAEGRQPVPFRIAEAAGQFALGNVALALESYRKALREDPQSIAAMTGMAACYEAMGRFDVSQRHYEAALALAPADTRLLGLLAGSLQRQGRIQEAAAVRTEIATRTAAAEAAAAAATAKLAEAAVAAPVPVSAPAPITPAPAPRVTASVTVTLPAAREVAEAPEAAAPLPVALKATVPSLPVALAPPVAPEFAVEAEPELVESVIDIPSGPVPVAVDAPARLAVPAVGLGAVPSAAFSVPPAPAAPAIPDPKPAALAMVRQAEAVVPRSAPPIPVAMPLVRAPAVPARPAQPVEQAQVEVRAIGPRLERLSLGEVALVTASDTPVRRAIILATAPRIEGRGETRLAMAPMLVLNAARSEGLAANTRRFLAARGIGGARIGDARRVRARTLIIAPPSQRALAQRIARMLNVAPLTVAGTRLTLVLGRDWMRARTRAG